MSLLKKLQSEEPGRNIVVIAIETLTNPAQMRQFYSEYVNYLRQNASSEDVRKNPEEEANSNIGYTLGYFDKETADRWMSSIPSVSHPIFGKNIFSVTPEQALEAGKIVAAKGDIKENIKKARDYIERDIK